MNISRVKRRSIELMVGLPHLREGPLLRRARALRQPVLISANGLSRWSRRLGWREWTGWMEDHLANAKGLERLCLDSAGFSAMMSYGGFPWSVDDYVRLASAYAFDWWASLDYCVEAEIARDREEVLDRISRTIRGNIDCRMRGNDAGIGATFLPVIQGRSPADYERCADALSGIIDRAPIVGVGSMCRRPVGGPEGLVAVVDHLDRVLPLPTRLHLFGVKGDALPYLRPYWHRVASIDSQAYGISARSEARRNRCSKPDTLVADHMSKWVHRQQARLREAPRHLPICATAPAAPVPDDPWEAAIAQARQEIRSLIEFGDLLGPV